MPIFRGLSATCSMSEFSVRYGERVPSKKSFEKNYIGAPDHGYSWNSLPPSRQRKAVLCNTNKHQEKLKKLGFEEVATYNGNDGIVHVMLYIQPKCRIKK